MIKYYLTRYPRNIPSTSKIKKKKNNNNNIHRYQFYSSPRETKHPTLFGLFREAKTMWKLNYPTLEIKVVQTPWDTLYILHRATWYNHFIIIIDNVNN